LFGSSQSRMSVVTSTVRTHITNADQVRPIRHHPSLDAQREPCYAGRGHGWDFRSRVVQRKSLRRFRAIGVNGSDLRKIRAPTLRNAIDNAMLLGTDADRRPS
jgi:hypothetical protein